MHLKLSLSRFCVNCLLLYFQEIRSIDASKRLRKTNFPANNRQSLALPASSKGKKSISPDESFFDDILNFEEDEEEEDTDDDLSLLTPPRKSKPRDLTRASPRQVNKSKKTELRRPFSGRQPSTKPPGVTTVDTSGIRLSLFEFGHIRVQETKAELECELSDNPGLRLDLESGRVCFCCQNVRFRMLNWAYSCQLCRRNVKYF